MFRETALPIFRGNNKNMRKLFLGGIIVIMAFVFFGLGFFIARTYWLVESNVQGKDGTPSCNTALPNNIINGKVTKVEGDKIFIEQQLKDAKKEFIITVTPETKITKTETFLDFSSGKELSAPTSIKNTESGISDITEGTIISVETTQTIGNRTEIAARGIIFSSLRADCGGSLQ